MPYRRQLLLRALGLTVMAAALPALRSHKAFSANELPPDADELALAALGERFLAAEPDSAPVIEASARKAAGLARQQAIDWDAARRASAVLTEPARIAAEFARNDTVFIDGWLLARSEIGAALLFAAVSARAQAAGPTR